MSLHQHEYFEECPYTTEEGYEHILRRMWALITHVEIAPNDDPWVLGGNMPISPVVMAEDDWQAYRAWKDARGLRSDAQILAYLQAYGFLPQHQHE